VTETAEGYDDVIGHTFTVTPGPADGHGGGMVKLGRSAAPDFGVSLPRDYSVSTWHGKVRNSRVGEGGCGEWSCEHACVTHR